MSLFDNFERRFLFVLTRYVAMSFIFSLILAVVLGGVFLSGFGEPSEGTKVTPDEVIDAIKPQPAIEYPQDTHQSQTAPPAITTSALPNIKLPFVLQKYFNTPENLKTLKDWLDDLPKEERQEFIDEMALVVIEAEKQKLNVTDAINKYQKIKTQKLEDEKIANIKRQDMLLKYAGATSVCIILIALFSLILVLLAIERNTRRIQP